MANSGKQWDIFEKQKVTSGKTNGHFWKTKGQFQEKKRALLENERAILEIKGHFGKQKAHWLEDKGTCNVTPHHPLLPSGVIIFGYLKPKKIFSWGYFFPTGQISWSLNSLKYPLTSPAFRTLSNIWRFICWNSLRLPPLKMITAANVVSGVQIKNFFSSWKRYVPLLGYLFFYISIHPINFRSCDAMMSMNIWGRNIF